MISDQGRKFIGAVLQSKNMQEISAAIDMLPYSGRLTVSLDLQILIKILVKEIEHLVGENISVDLSDICNKH